VKRQHSELLVLQVVGSDLTAFAVEEAVGFVPGLDDVERSKLLSSTLPLVTRMFLLGLNVRGDPNPQYWTLESEALTTETAQLPEQALLAAQVNNDQAARYRRTYDRTTLRNGKTAPSRPLIANF
jgi:hypothetical protein